MISWELVFLNLKILAGLTHDTLIIYMAQIIKIILIFWQSEPLALSMTLKEHFRRPAYLNLKFQVR